MSDDVRIRELRREEIEALVDDLWIPFSREMADLDPYNELAADVRDDAISHREERFDEDDVVTFVAVTGDEHLGYVSVEHRESPPVFARGDAGHVTEVYVRPAHRTQGIASGLLERAEAWARDRGCERATLSVNARNDAALGLYEDRGYEIRRHKLDRELE